ncbi:MAG: response regulator [Firmicutes bacterium]|jgi:YesN/AraC family two-component response regulator|nr:response regulator [Bacillota bacterium]
MNSEGGRGRLRRSHQMENTMDILKQLRVIYIEDNDHTRCSVEKFLKRRFGKVFLAENAEKGLSLFQRYHPDIAIVDILLPGMGGLELIKKARETGETCKFLITSSVSDVTTILEAVDLDIENYIVKPIDPYAFEEKLRRIGESIIKERKRMSAARSFTLENKSEVEEELRKGFIKLLKEKTGRGPRDAVALLTSHEVEISAYGVLGAMEKTLLLDAKNIGHVEEGRRLLYHSMEQEMVGLVKEAAGAFVELRSVKPDAKRDRETVRLLIAPGHPLSE